jgi:glycosyltransferase involved in cell wall biosynthesis
MAKRTVYLADARMPTEKAHGYQIAKMCEAFAQTGSDVLFLYPYRRQPDPAVKKTTVFEYYGIPPVFTPRKLPNIDVVWAKNIFPGRLFPPVFFSHAMLWGLYAALAARKQKADIYYTRESQIAFWLVRLGLPTVYEGHTVPKRGQRWLLRKIARQPALRLAVALTSFIKDGLVEMGFPTARVMVCPDGVDPSLFENLPGRNECRNRLGLPQGRRIIGYIGRFHTLEMEKGIPELIQAMARLVSLNGAQPLLLSVGGPMSRVPAYLKIAQQSGLPEQCIQFVDRVPNREVVCWISACDVVTIPWPWTEFSAYFTSPLKLFEYMASGVPIVASDLPSIREILRHGENAWLVTPGDPEALAEGIQHVLSHSTSAKEMSEQALRDVQRHAWQSRASAILDRIGEASRI